MAPSLGLGLLAEERLRLAELGALRVGLLAERQELGVVRPGLGLIAREARGSRGAVEPPEAVRLHAHRRLELPQRLGRLVRLEEHLGQKLARRRERPRGHGVLLGRALAVGGGPEENERLVLLPLGARHPGRRDRALDVDLLRPVADLRRGERVAKRAEAVSAPPGGRRIAAPRGAEGSREHELRLGLWEAAPRELLAEELEPRRVRPATPLEGVTRRNRRQREPVNKGLTVDFGGPPNLATKPLAGPVLARLEKGEAQEANPVQLIKVAPVGVVGA